MFYLVAQNESVFLLFLEFKDWSLSGFYFHGYWSLIVYKGAASYHLP